MDQGLQTRIVDMAIKAVAMVNSLSVDPSGMYFQITCSVADDSWSETYGPMAVGTTMTVAVLNGILAFLKNQVEARHTNINFNAGDAIQLHYHSEVTG